MNIVERDVSAYWNASCAYRGKKYKGSIGTTANLIKALRAMCLIGQWRVASLAGKLLEDVIEDRVTTNDSPAEIYPLLPKGAASEYSDFLHQVLAKQFQA